MAIFLRRLFDQRQERLSKRKKVFVWRSVSGEEEESMIGKEIGMADTMGLDQHTFGDLRFPWIYTITWKDLSLPQCLGSRMGFTGRVLLRVPSGSRCVRPTVVMHLKDK